MTRSSRADAFPALIFAFAACGGRTAFDAPALGDAESVEASPIVDAGPVESAIEGEGAVDASPPDDASEAEAEAESGAASSGVGLVYLANLGTYQSDVSAEFYAGVTTLPPACSGTTVGPCIVYPACPANPPQER